MCSPPHELKQIRNAAQHIGTSRRERDFGALLIIAIYGSPQLRPSHIERGPNCLRVALTLLERNANACILARVLAGYLPRSLRDFGERKPHASAPAEVGLHKPCQVKNSAAGRVNEPKLKNLPGSPMLSNAPV